MTTFNTATINKVKFIAECAHEDCALTTLKNAKEQVTNRCKVFAGYESQWNGIDRAEVIECFTQAMDCRTKSDFSRRIELLLETMRNMEIEHERAAERAKIAAATPRTAPQEITANHAAQIEFFSANDFAARRDMIEAAHAEALEIDAQKARNWLAFAGRNVFDTLTNADHRRKAIDAAHAEALDMEAARQLTARQARFVFHNTAAERVEIIEAAHAEALKINVMADIQADVIAAPHLPALVNACHAEALAEDRAHNSAWCALAMYPHFNELETDERRRKALNAAHAEALAENARPSASPSGGYWREGRPRITSPFRRGRRQAIRGESSYPRIRCAQHCPPPGELRSGAGAVRQPRRARLPGRT